MLDDLQHLLDGVRALVSRLEPEALSGPDARRVVEGFVELEKLAAAGKTLAVGRLDRTGAWVGDGSFRDIEAWMASITGTSIGAARASMGTARRVVELPQTATAIRAGRLSPAQAAHVSAAAKADPTAEAQLLDTARHAGIKGLRIECDRVTAAAQTDEIENYERIHSLRSLRHRRLSDGTGHIDIRGPLDRTAQIIAALEPHEQDLFEVNRARGRCEPADATRVRFARASHRVGGGGPNDDAHPQRAAARDRRRPRLPRRLPAGHDGTGRYLRDRRRRAGPGDRRSSARLGLHPQGARH